MAQPLVAPPSQNYLQKTLQAQLAAGATSAATLNNTTGIQNLYGVMIVDRVDANGVETPTKREEILFSGTSGSTVVTLTRGLGGTTDQVHEVGAIVEFVPSVKWAQSIYDALSEVVTPSTGALDTTKVVTPTGTQTLTNKTLTAPVLNGNLTGTGIVDEDDMSSDSETMVPTQQSVKAYVDSKSAPTLTRKLWIPPTAFMAHTGSPVRQVLGGAVSAVAWLMDASSTEVVVSEFIPLPADYSSGNLTVKSLFAMASATSGNVVIDAQYAFMADGESAAGVTGIGNATVAVPGSAETLKVYEHTSSLSGMSAGDFMKFRFIRAGDNGSDTATGDLYFFGLAIEYTASN